MNEKNQKMDLLQKLIQGAFAYLLWINGASSSPVSLPDTLPLNMAILHSSLDQYNNLSSENYNNLAEIGLMLPHHRGWHRHTDLIQNSFSSWRMDINDCKFLEFRFRS